MIARNKCRIPCKWGCLPRPPYLPTVTTWLVLWSPGLQSWWGTRSIECRLPWRCTWWGRWERTGWGAHREAQTIARHTRCKWWWSCWFFHCGCTTATPLVPAPWLRSLIRLCHTQFLLCHSLKEHLLLLFREHLDCVQFLAFVTHLPATRPQSQGKLRLPMAANVKIVMNIITRYNWGAYLFPRLAFLWRQN